MTQNIRLPLSLVVITLNEERNIQKCLSSVPFASEIVVVDSLSQDRTQEIARQMGAKVLTKEWLGFGAQKQFAVDQAQYDWVLSLDADERLSPEAQLEIVQAFSGLDPQVGYEFARKSWHLGRWIVHGGWYPDWQLRLFHRKHSSWKLVPVHELVVAPRRQRLRHPILHDVFQDFQHQLRTNDRYSTLQAEEHFRKEERFSLHRLVVKPWVKFVECYFLKQGFRDGLPGFVIAVSAAYSVFCRWVKVWELEQQRKTK